MGNRQKRRAKLAAERKAEAIAFTSKYAQKTHPVSKPAGRPPVAVLAAIGVVVAALFGGAYLTFGGGGQTAHAPMKIWSAK